MGLDLKGQLSIWADHWPEKLVFAGVGAVALILIGLAYNTWLISMVAYPDRSPPASILEFVIQRPGLEPPLVGEPPIVYVGADAQMMLLVDKRRRCRPVARLILIDGRNEIRSIRLPEWPALDLGTTTQRFLFRVPDVPSGIYHAQGQVDYDCGMEGLQIVRSPQIALDIRPARGRSIYPPGG